MAKIKKRNHYLPRFYLKGFSDSQSRIWMYDKTNPKNPVSGSPGDIAVVKKLYHLENNADAKDEIENYFEKSVETPASPAFKKLLNKQFPNNKDKKILSLFFGMLMVRTPLYIAHLNMQQSKELNAIAKTGAANKEYFHSIYNKIHPTLSEADIEVDRNSILKGEFSFKESNDHALATMLILGSEVAPLLQKMKWNLLETNSDLPFITSDNFIHASNPTITTGFYNVGLGLTDTCVHIPISTNLSLLMVNRDSFHENMVYNISNPPTINGEKINLKELIKNFNKKIFCECDKYIFANSDSEQLKRCFTNILDKIK